MFGGPYTFGSRAVGSGEVSAPLTGLKVYVDGVLTAVGGPLGHVLDATLSVEQSINQRSTVTFTLVNPLVIPTEGVRVLVLHDEERLFAGTIDEVQHRTDETGITRYYDCTCADFQQILDHLVHTATYTDSNLRTIIEAVWAAELQAEALTLGNIDPGPAFSLVDANELRVSDLFRDLADGAGVSWWIDPYRNINMVSTSLDAAPFGLTTGTSGTLHAVTVTKSRELYRNVMRVRCRSADGSSEVIIERTDAAQIVERQRKEGGTGRYEVYESIEHPTSNDTVELQRLATTYAVITLARSGRISQSLQATLHRRGLHAGQTIAVTLPLHAASGTWSITQVRYRHLYGDQFQYDIEAVATSTQELALNAYLKIIRAGKATILLPIGLFTGVTEFTADGTYTVPGVVDQDIVDIEIDCFGPGGGGGGYSGVRNINGGLGGSGGKGVTFLTLAAGTVLDVVVQAPGTGGVGNAATTATFTTPGSSSWPVPGGSGTVELEITTSGGGGGGGGGTGGFLPIPGVNGGNGGWARSIRTFAAGTNLTIIVGAGGAGSAITGPGSIGGLSSVDDGVFTYAKGNGGGGGGGPGGDPGADGSGTGDQVTSGAGGGGGAGGNPTPGANGSNGTVVIRYAKQAAGANAGAVQVQLGGLVKCHANGGTGGGPGYSGGTPGAHGTAFGDQTFTGEGSAGGPGGTSATLSGSAGQAGKVQIRN